MIFEFFKRFFWKADEGGRKRKINDSISTDEDESIYSKRLCQDFMQNNHLKIASNKSKNNMGCSKANSQFSASLKFKNLENVSTTKIEMLDTSNKQSSLEEANDLKIRLYKCEKPPFSEGQCELINQHTLHKAHALSAKMKYNEMLLHFIPHDINSSDKDSMKSIKQQHSTYLKNVKSNKSLSLAKCNYNQLLRNNKIQTYQQSPFLNKSDHLNMQLKKTAADVNFEKVDNKKYNNATEQGCSMPTETIKINTLREKFLNKKVVKEEFISQISKKYNERLDQHYKEAAELEKMTYILSRHNQLTREANFEDHLSRSMRLCEAVLDERELIEESRLPELNKDMLERVKVALSVGSTDEILVQEFGLRISKKDIQTLAGLNWLNDEIINFYMNLLIERGKNEKYPSIYAMNTFFYPKLISSGHASLKRWTRKVDIFAKDMIVVPIHLGIHWCMSIIDFRNKSIKYYDSMGSPNYKCLQVLKQYLLDESIDKKKKTFDFHNWTFECMKDIPQQMNGSDCGVFSCVFAEYICADKNFDFSQEDMPYFRNKMAYEILAVQLL